jgi:hypothetical protein
MSALLPIATTKADPFGRVGANRHVCFGPKSGHWSATEEAVYAQLIQSLRIGKAQKNFRSVLGEHWVSTCHIRALEWKRY